MNYIYIYIYIYIYELDVGKLVPVDLSKLRCI